MARDIATGLPMTNAGAYFARLGIGPGLKITPIRRPFAVRVRGGCPGLTILLCLIRSRYGRLQNSEFNLGNP
jgi:hypothetical protein